MTGGARTFEKMLHGIEHLVLEEVWLGRGRSVTGWSVVASVAATAMLWCTSAVGPVPSATMTMFLLASASSAVALVRRRYRWCCAAAYCCALASVFGTGAFWWLRTGRTSTPLAWLTIADVAVVALTIFWLGVIAMPIDRSQPDMRSRRVQRR